MKITADIADEHGFDILDDDALHDMFDSYIDDMQSPLMIMGLEYFQVAKIWKDIDTTAYDTGFNDWLDGESRNVTITELSDGEWMDTDKYNELVSELEEEDENEEDE
ncbi:MAG: hypothetical protein WC479_10185 [Candidatus Izemoplasmatales bacterium]